VGDDRFDHLELGGDAGSLSEALKADLRETRFTRIEIQALPGGPPKAYSIRLDGRRVFQSGQDEIPPYYDSLFDYLGQHGVTPRLREFFGELGREVVLVEDSPAAAPASGGDGALPEELVPALKNAGYRRIEFGPAQTPSGEVMAMRTDGKKLHYANDESLTPWDDDLLHYAAALGVTAAFIQAAKELGTTVVLVDKLPAKAPPPAAAEAPMIDIPGVTSGGGTPLMKLARVAAILFGAWAYWQHQHWLDKHPRQRELEERAKREAQAERADHEEAVHKAINNQY
jgi:hypothetical protein